MDPTGAKLLPHLEEHARRLKAHDERVIREQKAFESFDPKSLVDMSPEELSAFQSSFLPSSPQFIVAAHEWNNRLVAAHIKAIDAHSRSGTLTTVYVGVGCLVLGLILTALKEHFLPDRVANQAREQISQDSADQGHADDTKINPPAHE